MARTRKTPPRWEDLPMVLVPEEAAPFLRMDVMKLREMLRQGLVPGKKLGGQYIIPKAELGRYLGINQLVTPEQIMEALAQLIGERIECRSRHQE